MMMIMKGVFSAGAVFVLTMGRAVAEILYAGVNSGEWIMLNEIY
jgi:hypothetical protein